VAAEKFLADEETKRQVQCDARADPDTLTTREKQVQFDTCVFQLGVVKKAKEAAKAAKLATQELKDQQIEHAAVLAEIDSLPGPFMRSMHAFEKAHHIEHEFYHGGAFNGNTCQKVLKSREAMLEALQPKKLRRANCPLVVFGDVDWLQKQLFWCNKFASVEELYSASRPLCKHEIALLEARATDLGMYGPLSFKHDSLLHKFHMVTCEMHRHVKLMASEGISPGMANEQSIEVGTTQTQRTTQRTHTHTHTNPRTNNACQID
jgi:hypothetical protein